MKPLVDWWIGSRGRGPGQVPGRDGADVGAGTASARPSKFAVVVTGGSQGIGLEIARVFAGDGWPVVLVARDEAGLSRAAEEICRAGGADVRWLALDLTSDDCDLALSSYLETQGLVCDILVNNAGFGLGGAYVTMPAERLEAMLRLNVLALNRLTRRFLPNMVARRRGGVMNVASLGGYPPGPYQAAYYASKAFVISLTEGLAWELRGRGVRLTCVAPGPVETEFHAKAGAQGALYRRVVSGISARRVAEVAVVSFWLGRTSVVPGLLWKFTALAIYIMPRKILSAIVGVILKPRGGGRHARRASS